jgi:hypothetical protein
MRYHRCSYRALEARAMRTSILLLAALVLAAVLF